MDQKVLSAKETGTAISDILNIESDPWPHFWQVFAAGKNFATKFSIPKHILLMFI